MLPWRRIWLHGLVNVDVSDVRVLDMGKEKGLQFVISSLSCVALYTLNMNLLNGDLMLMLLPDEC